MAQQQREGVSENTEGAAATAEKKRSASRKGVQQQTLWRSSKAASLDVQWGSATVAWLARAMPVPLSATSMSCRPQPRSRTVTAVAPASRAFSTSSLTALGTSTTTWPLQMRRTVAASIGRTLPMPRKQAEGALAHAGTKTLTVSVRALEKRHSRGYALSQKVHVP